MTVKVPLLKVPVDEHVAHCNKRWSLVRLAANVAIFSLVFIIIEGLASCALFFRDIMTSPSVEQRHIKYDPDLGWMNEPNTYIPDMYGPGVYYRTNGQGFRNNHDISSAVATGKVRIVCSGDSFTLGYGVDNDHTWCSLLSFLEPGFETVNMGHGGYGVDQAYLLYKRDAANIEHHVQLLAFITHDFHRMQHDSFQGYAKPILAVENDRLVVKNVPITRDYFPLISRSIDHLRGLRSVEFLYRAARKIKIAMLNSPELTQGEKNRKTREVLRKIFEDLKRINEQRSSKLVLVYFPILDELKGEEPKEWIQFLEEESRRLEIPLINFFAEFRTLSHNEVVNLFISQGQIGYLGTGHFNNAGNEFVAKVIHDKLMNYLSCCPLGKQIFSVGL